MMLVDYPGSACPTLKFDVILRYISILTQNIQTKQQFSCNFHKIFGASHRFLNIQIFFFCKSPCLETTIWWSTLVFGICVHDVLGLLKHANMQGSRERYLWIV